MENKEQEKREAEEKMMEEKKKDDKTKKKEEDEKVEQKEEEEKKKKENTEEGKKKEKKTEGEKEEEKKKCLSTCLDEEKQMLKDLRKRYEEINWDAADSGYAKKMEELKSYKRMFEERRKSKPWIPKKLSALGNMFKKSRPIHDSPSVSLTSESQTPSPTEQVRRWVLACTNCHDEMHRQFTVTDDSKVSSFCAGGIITVGEGTNYCLIMDVYIN